METASDDEVLQYFQSLQRSAALLGEPIPGAEAEEDGTNPAAQPSEAEGASAPAAAPTAPAAAAPSPAVAGASPPSAPPPTAPPQAEPPQPPADAASDAAALREMKIEVITLLKDLAAEVKVANAQQLTGLRVALKLARGKMKSLGGE